MHLNPKNVFGLINSVYVEKLNSEIFFVFNVALVSYRDLNLQNANKLTSFKTLPLFLLQFTIRSLQLKNNQFEKN